MHSSLKNSFTEFPNDFIFGAATSSYQIEGNNTNSNWYEWEKKQGITPCGMACDSWNRYKEDHKLLKDFGFQAYRLSIEWSRIFITPTQIDFKALEHYEEILVNLKKNNIKVFLTLQHHTLPKWLKKGWENPDIPDLFCKYVRFIGNELYKYVDAWMPINEPAVNNIYGYYGGNFPPGKFNIFSMIKVKNNQLKAHQKAYQTLKEIAPDIPVGFVKNMAFFKPFRNQIKDKFLCRSYEYFFNNNYINSFKHKTFPLNFIRNSQIQDSIDFWALNYYTHVWASYKFPGNRKFNFDRSIETTDMGWEWDSEGLQTTIKRLWNINNKPIYITENGIATTDDNKRMEYIYQHLNSTLKTISRGINVKGYFYWSLLDNFEWEHGYFPKFGLAAIDDKTFVRKPKQSGYYLGKIAKERKLFPPEVSLKLETL